ncbi:hypothetical protein RUM43_006168 [Polyplax serrata]|uniref:PH domain-containing protein n=1 Tax=Polyplax serrata TaxID=468196 RepID=A0AAN8S8Z0_POLSC
MQESQLDPEITQTSVSPAIVMDNKKSSPSAQSGRRKSGGSTQLRSPIVKRPSTAPVALQGWLHKQGSEGLMLWKKRWFVLSEYCLFYYKGPEEEKLLGSILLPSYKVSVCTADDKVYRKFAFKAEHVNMRTYYFAAESRELMTQWMNALSLATILQEGTKLPYQDHQNRTSMPSLVKQNSDEFGFQSYNAVSGPITVQPTSQDRNMKDSSANMNGWAGPNPAGPNQPLYANAPPKPKRLNNEGQYGSSPEASPNRRDDAENILYSSRKRFQETLNPARPQEYHYHSYKTGYPSGSIPDTDMSRSISHSGTYSGEERSPVNTTWTDVKSTNFIRNMPREEELNSNYSDVFKNSNYNLGPPLRSEGTNFPGYGNAMNSSHANYQHPNQYYQSYQQSPQRQFDLQELESGRLDQGRRYQPPRPHSADFLDYDAKKYYPNKKNMESMIVEKSSGKFDQFNSPRPPRPKSSLDIVPSNDGYYWSEERYAEKMRQSAMYLQNTPTQRSQSSRANTPTARRTNESSALLPDVKNVNEQILANLRQKMTVPTTARQNLRRWSEHQDRIDNTFMRSASARVPKHGTHDDESDEVQAYTGGQDFNEGRKEESMKRLLEWKQRMLQSPLTRKLSGSSTRGVAQNELSKSYKQQVLKELEKQEAKSREDLGKRKSKADGSRIQNRMSDSRRSAILSSDRYYSYSSDDEENEKISEERTRKTSQSRKSRKEVEDSKGRKTVTNPGILKTVNFASPNYENIKQSHDSEGRYTVYEIESLEKDPDVEDKVMTKKPRIVRSEAGSKSEQSQSARGSHPLPLAEKSGSGRRSLGNSDAELGIQPTHYDHKVQQYKKPNWNEKIDETKLIKEFSYQYIKDPHSYESDPANNNSTTVNNSSAEVLPENIVKSRVKQLEQIDPESSGSDGIKEPLKVSSPNYYLNEAHISSLKHSDGTEKSQEVKKPIGKSQSVETSPQKPQEQANTEMPERHQKSVKDLLADFERKSQLAQEREEHEKSFEEVPGKRCVFSDTETLLYDTSSDTEDKKREPDASILSGLKKSETRRIEDDLTEEEDRDEEVSAALGKRERYFSSGRDSGRKRESDFLQRGKRLSKPLPAEPSPSSDVETTITPGYLGSTMPDSTAPVENSDSTCSTPTIERIKDNLEKTLPKENWTKKAQEVVKEEENCEGHYMPMTPSRRVSAPSSDKSRSTSSLQSFPYGGDAEETYVEMTENLVEPNKSSLSRIRKSFTDQHIPNYCEVTGNDSVPHYDFLYRSGMLSEPEYMEVNTLLEILKEQDEKLKERKDAVVGKSDVKSDQDFAPPTPPRSTLPDILNSSASQQALKSDSSDADDESSKDLDSLDIPRHPRFSLSDTFRPASYYLGSAINGRDRSVIRLPNPNENHDSSDSDLVSPPPIPTSPPPLDDLDTSLETERSVEIKLQNLTKYKLMGKDGSKKLWNASGSSQDAETDEDTKKKKRRPVSEDMLDTLEEAEQFFYEKPLVFSELDSIGSRNGLALDEDINDINLDQYLEELQLNGSMNAQLYTKDFSENIYKSSEKEIHKNLMSKESVNKMNPTEKSLLKLTYPNEQNKVNDDGTSHERSKSLEEAQYENLQTLFPPPPPELYESSNEQSDRESSLAMYRTAPFPEVPPPDNYCDVCDPVDQNKVCFDPDTLQHQVSSPENATAKSNGCFEPQGAPYYYSDIIKNDDADFGNSNPEKSSLALRGSRYQPLNNQRDNPQEVSQCSKRNDIGRKVNPISQNYLAQGNQPDEMDDVQKITAELRTTSAHFMGAADKSGTVDARNIYESDTLQRRKGGTTAQADESRVRTPDMHHPQGVARNLYPQGLKDKSPGISAISNLPHGKFLANTHNRERSRSVDGLLNEPGQFSAGENVELGTTERVPENVTNVANSSMNQSCEGEDLWDKDTLWRENLRKVSLRHTRSLDNLDDDITWNSGQRLNASEKVENPDKFQSGRRSVDHFADTRKSTQSGRRSADHFSAVANRNKVSRNVTYVNDTIRPNKSVDLISEYEEDYREGRIRSRKKESDIQRVVELSDSGVLDCDDGVHYEKLTRTPKRSGEVNFDYGYDWERQRDMFKRDQPVGKEVSPRGKASFLVEGASDDSTPVAQSPGNEGLALEPLDREKLRQWDLMSSGTVEQEVEQRKFDQQEVEKDSNLKKHEDPPSDADIGEYVVMERRSREKQPMEVTQNLEESLDLKFLE